MKDHTAKEVIAAMNRLEREMGEKKFREVFKSITVDNGVEFSDFEGMERSRRNKKPRTKLYYCHAYCSCERARNENQNRMIRRFTRKEVKELEAWMNTYPRPAFDGKTASEMYDIFQDLEREGTAA